MKKVFLLALAAIAAGGASATITQQHVYGGSLFGDAIQTRLDAGYVNPYFTPLTPADNQVTLTLTNTPSGWKHTAWLSHAGSSTAADRIAAHYTETDFVNPLPYEWHSQTDQNAWRAIVARFDPIKVTFKFDVNGGSTSKGDIVFNHSTNQVNLSSYNGTRSGYSLEGWKNDAGEVVYRTSLLLNRLGYPSTTNLLTRWFASADGSARELPGRLPFGVLGNADTNIWLHASWTGNVYKVIFDANGGVIPGSSAGTTLQRSVTFGDPYGYVPKATCEGKTFLGWSKWKSSFSSVTSATIVDRAQDHKVYAWWGDQHVVTFKYRNASGKLVSEDKLVDDGGSATAPSDATVNQWPGHVFTNWDRSFANVTESITVNAQYSANVYTVVFDANGSAVSGTMANQSFTCGVSQALRANKYARQGYSYGGWNTAADGTGTPYSDAESVSDLTFEDGGIVTLYAQWVPIPYIIAFSGGDGAEGEMPAMYATYGFAVTLPMNSFTKSGCEFQHWQHGTTNFADRATVSNLTTTAGETVTLTAVWDAPYYIAFDANGGEGAMDVQRFERGETKALSSNEFSRTGYAFSGWATNAAEAAALNVRYADGQVVVDIGEVAATNTLYAVWSTNAYWVAFDANGGEGDAMAPQRFVYDQPQNLTSNTYSMGELWRFDGWSNTVDGVVYGDGVAVSNLCTEADATNTLVAVWVSNLSDLSKAMHCTNLQWYGRILIVGGNPQNGVNRWISQEGAEFGYENSGSCAEQTGVAGDTLVASVTTNGTLSFLCRNTSSVAALLDMTVNRNADALLDAGQQLVPIATLPANCDWQQVAVDIDQGAYSGTGDLYIKFTVRTSSAVVQIDQMTWTPEGGGSPEPTDADRVEPSSVSVSGGEMTISFTGDSTFSYHLLATDSLSPTNWYDYGGTNVGADALQSFEIPIDSEHPQRFFKIEVIKKSLQ